MVIKNINLETVCGITSVLPENDKPEIAFAGKSNVGKSSLINALMNRKSYARISATPGKTQTINFYTINEEMYLVDLPGYGYAKVAKTEKRRWAELIDGYLESDRDIRLTFLLLDMRHAPSKDDLQMIEYLIAQEMPFVIVLTKADKLNKSQRKARMEAFQTEIPYFSDIHVIPFSAMTREGVDEVRDVITELAEADETDAE